MVDVVIRLLWKPVSNQLISLASREKKLKSSLDPVRVSNQLISLASRELSGYY